MVSSVQKSDSLIISGLSSDQIIYLAGVNEELQNKHVGFDKIFKVLINHIASFRVANKMGMSVEIARKNVFGPTTEDLKGPLTGVSCYAVLPRALGVLDESQKEERNSLVLRVPASWHQWKLSSVGLARICIASGEDLLKWVDQVKVFGATPYVIALVGIDPAEKDEMDTLPDGESFIFGIRILDSEHLLGIEKVPRGMGDFFENVVVRHSASFDEIHDLLTLSSYKELNFSTT